MHIDTQKFQKYLSSIHDFGTGPILQHAADERIRLEELRHKVKNIVVIYICIIDA